MKIDIEKLFNWLRIVFVVLLCITIYTYLHRFLNYIGGVFSREPAYQTVYVQETIKVNKPDTIIRWLEKIKQVYVEPETVYKYVEYSSINNHLIRKVVVNGKHIAFNTQFCDTNMGQRFVYPYTKYFQAVPSDSGMNFIRYRDFLDWDKLLMGISYDVNRNGSYLRFSSKVRVLPLRFSVEPYVHYIFIESDFSYGINFEYQIW